MKVLLLSIFCVLLASPAYAQGRIAVLPLDDTEGSTSVATRMAELLTTGGRDVVFGDPVFQRVLEHRVEPDPDAAAEFSGISEQIASGINQFFYAGNEDALKILSPVLQKGLQHFDYVVTRPDLVAQLYEASLIMVRAYKGLKREDDMKTTATLLARYFPMMAPNLKSSPPDILALMKDTKAELLETPGSRVGIELRENRECRRYLNGTQIKEGAYPVAPDSDVFLYIECEGQRSPVWKLKVPAGKSIVVPLSTKEIDSLVMGDDSFEARRSAEEVMAAVAFWGGFDEVVGLRQPATMNTAPTLFGHLKQGRVTWTETRDTPAFVGFVEQTFAVSVDAPAQAQSEGSSTDWSSIALTSGGIVLAGVGGALIYFGHAEAQDLICTGFTTESPSGCDSGPADFISEDEFNDRKSKANLYSVGGISLVGAGLGLAVWGIYGLVTGDGEAEASRLTPTADGFVWRFQ